MRLLLLISISLICSAMSVSGQLSIMSHGLQPLKFGPSQMLDVTLSNASLNQYTAHIKASLTDNKGQLVCHVQSSEFQIMPGTNKLLGQSIIEDYNFGASPTASYAERNGKLITGEYNLEVELNAPGLEFPVLGQFPIFSSMSSFLQLVSPMDESVISEKNPLLTWMNTGAFPTSDPFEKFQMILCEINIGQLPAEAIVENEPQLIVADLKTHALIYPLQVKALEIGKSYAWIVQHKYEDQLIASTDVWSFSIVDWQDPRDQKYVNLTRSSPSDVVNVYDSFYFRFDESYSSSESVKVQLTDSQGKVTSLNAIKDNDKVIGQSGFSGYRLKFSDEDLIYGKYILEVKDMKGESYNINLQYQK